MSAALLKKMRELGLSIDQAIDLMEAMEAEAQPKPAEVSKGAARTRRWRERKEGERHGDVSSDDHGDVTLGDDPSPPSFLPPRPPNQTTPTPVNITTRARPIAAKPNGFAKFWEAYPLKVGKPAAEKAFAKALGKIGGDEPLRHLLDGLDRAKHSRAFADPDFIPHPTTWLNQGRWDDRPAEVIPINRQAENRTYAQRPDAKRTAREANYARAFAAAERIAEHRDE